MTLIDFDADIKLGIVGLLEAFYGNVKHIGPNTRNISVNLIKVFIIKV